MNWFVSDARFSCEHNRKRERIAAAAHRGRDWLARWSIFVVRIDCGDIKVPLLAPRAGQIPAFSRGDDVSLDAESAWISCPARNRTSPIFNAISRWKESISTNLSRPGSLCLSLETPVMRKKKKKRKS